MTDSDPLPHVICVKCVEQLDALCGFAEVARKTEDVLHQFLAYTKQLNGSSQVNKQNNNNVNNKQTSIIVAIIFHKIPLLIS